MVGETVDLVIIGIPDNADEIIDHNDTADGFTDRIELEMQLQILQTVTLRRCLIHDYHGIAA